MEQNYPRIDKLLTERPSETESIIFATRGGCPPLPRVSLARDSAYCADFLATAIEISKDSSINRIVIGAAWLSYFTNDYNIKGLDDSNMSMATMAARPLALGEFSNIADIFKIEGKRVYLLLTTPHSVHFDPRSLVERPLWKLAASPYLSRQEFERDTVWLMNELRRIAAKSGATVIDPSLTLCDAEKCPALADDGRPIYRDSGHVRASFVREHFSFLDQTVLIAK